jgi:YHS domain-containing protein
MQEHSDMKIKALFIAALAVLGLGLAAAPAALAREPETYIARSAGVAVSGYDPVAYFTVGRPVEGSTQFTATYRGATYRFSSAANRDAFVANPARYAPQYGGYCAWAVSQGYTARGNPNNWRIVDGRLYLNFDSGVQRRWERDIPGFIASANANWPSARDTYRGPR